MDIKTKLMGRGLTVSTVSLTPKSTKKGQAFETLVIHRLTEFHEWDRKTYTSEAEALAGHKEMVNKWKVVPRKQIREQLAKLRE